MTKQIFCLQVYKLKPKDQLKAATFGVEETRLRAAPFFEGNLFRDSSGWFLGGLRGW